MSQDVIINSITDQSSSIGRSPVDLSPVVDRLASIDRSPTASEQLIDWIPLDVQIQNVRESETRNRTDDWLEYGTDMKDMTAEKIRKRNKSFDDAASEKNGMCSVFKKENIEVDISEGDSLHSLALKYNCSIAELKAANQPPIYTEQDFYALKKINIPIHVFSELIDTVAADTTAETVAETAVSIDMMNKTLAELGGGESMFSVQKPHHIRVRLTSMDSNAEDTYGDRVDIDDDDEEEDYDDTAQLIVTTSMHKKSSSTGSLTAPVDESGRTAEEFLEEIQQRIDEVGSRATSDNEDIVGVQLIDATGKSSTRRSSDSLGNACGLSWRWWMFLAFLFVAGIPLLVYLVVHYSPESFKKFHFM